MKKKKKLDKFVMGVMVYWVVFVVTMTIIFCVKGAVPDTLIQYGLGGGAIELAATAVIEVFTNKGKKNDNSYRDDTNNDSV